VGEYLAGWDEHTDWVAGADSVVGVWAEVEGTESLCCWEGWGIMMRRDGQGSGWWMAYELFLGHVYDGESMLIYPIASYSRA
jgi:hypothetical protein